jgi:hypothetical protein
MNGRQKKCHQIIIIEGEEGRTGVTPTPNLMHKLRNYFLNVPKLIFEIDGGQKVSLKVSLDRSINEKVSPNNNDNNNNGDFIFALCCAFNLEKYFTMLKKVYRF